MVSAVDGMALGGGCEFQMHSDRVVATLEATSASSKSGVGCCQRAVAWEMAFARHWRPTAATCCRTCRRHFKNAAMGGVDQRAERQEKGLMRWRDIIVFNRDELLFVALTTARAMAKASYRRPANQRAFRWPTTPASPR